MIKVEIKHIKAPVTTNQVLGQTKQGWHAIPDSPWWKR
jgi:hypothetical protein